MYAVGRIKEGVTFDVAQRDMTTIGKRNEALYPQTNTGHIPALQPLREALVGSEMRSTSILLLAVVGFVLLMCCANVANLLLARTMSRTRELAVRSALGASRRRIVSQILTESLVLAAVGGLVGGLTAAAALTRYLSTLLYAVKPLDPITFVAVPIVLIVTAAIAVAAPAWRAARVDPVMAFRSE